MIDPLINIGHDFGQQVVYVAANLVNEQTRIISFIKSIANLLSVLCGASAVINIISIGNKLKNADEHEVKEVKKKTYWLVGGLIVIGAALQIAKYVLVNAAGLNITGL